MTHRLHGAMAVALIVAAPLATWAQAGAAASAPAAKPARHHSAFDSYRRFDDQKVEPWREANDKVGRIGGWRAYAREAAGSAPAAEPPAPLKPAASSAMPHHHHHHHHKSTQGGHSMPKTP